MRSAPPECAPHDTPPHTQVGLFEMQAKRLLEASEFVCHKWFGENIRDIVIQGDAYNVSKTFIDNVSNGVIFHLDMFDIVMIGVVISEQTSSVVIAVDWDTS